jgi:hypothetical protein
MVELDTSVEVTGVDGPVPFLDLFQGRDTSGCRDPTSRMRPECRIRLVLAAKSMSA